MYALELRNINFSYNKAQNIIKDFSLSVEKGSFTTLLGQSGSGKTTLLRLILGFINPSSGNIIINNECVNKIRPENRKVGMVFQDYALFPHLSVQQNILYGLKIQKSQDKRITKEQMNYALKEVCSMLDLSSLLSRSPNELSGGQQQRVALARALILKPNILLMDEPLSSLDTKLRQNLRSQLKQIQKQFQITTIYVTHDQEEALSLSDKVAVINNGTLLQFGTPRQVYFAPKDNFTADFIGNANFINIQNKKYMIRPEWCKISLEKQSTNCVKAKVLDLEFLGSKIRYKMQCENQIITVDGSSALLDEFAINQEVYVEFMFKKAIED